MRGNLAFESSDEKKLQEEVICGKQRKDSQQKRGDYLEDVEKSRADSAALCRESYMNDPEKSVAHSTARSCESYKRDPEKSHADRYN